MRVLITGATSGIGNQLALDYLANGHTVHCCGRNTEALEDLKKISEDRAEIHVFDTGNLNEVRDSLEHIPTLDTIILNAGTCEYINASQFDAEMFERVMQTLTLIHI